MSREVVPFPSKYERVPGESRRYVAWVDGAQRCLGVVKMHRPGLWSASTHVKGEHTIIKTCPSRREAEIALDKHLGVLVTPLKHRRRHGSRNTERHGMFQHVLLQVISHVRVIREASQGFLDQWEDTPVQEQNRYSEMAGFVSELDDALFSLDWANQLIADLGGLPELMRLESGWTEDTRSRYFESHTTTLYNCAQRIGGLLRDLNYSLANYTLGVNEDNAKTVKRIESALQSAEQTLRGPSAPRALSQVKIKAPKIGEGEA